MGRPIFRTSFARKEHASLGSHHNFLKARDIYSLLQRMNFFTCIRQLPQLLTLRARALRPLSCHCASQVTERRGPSIAGLGLAWLGVVRPDSRIAAHCAALALTKADKPLRCLTERAATPRNRTLGRQRPTRKMRVLLSALPVAIHWLATAANDGVAAVWLKKCAREHPSTAELATLSTVLSEADIASWVDSALDERNVMQPHDSSNIRDDIR